MGRRARTGCGAAAVGATPEEGSVWPTSCFRPSENPEGTWQPVWVADESGLGGWPVRREPLAGRLGHCSLPLGPLSGPQATRGDCLSTPNREPWAGCWPQGPWPWGTLFLFAPHLPECQTPRPAQRLLERIRVPETCGPLLGWGSPALNPRDPLLWAGPRREPRTPPPSLRPPSCGRPVRPGPEHQTGTSNPTRHREPGPPPQQAPAPDLPCVPGLGDHGGRSPRYVCSRHPASLQPSRPPGLRPGPARRVTAEPRLCLAPGPRTKPCPPPPADLSPLTSAGHQA